MNITTTYTGPTNYAGARITARGMGRKVTQSYDYALSPTANHERVAQALAYRATLTPATVHRTGESRTGRGYRYTV